MSSNSVCNHTCDDTRDFVITRMITDRIGLHSVLLPINHWNLLKASQRSGWKQPVNPEVIQRLPVAANFSASASLADLRLLILWLGLRRIFSL